MSDGINGPREYGERNEWDERMKQIHLAIADAMRSHEINIHKPLREKVAALEGDHDDLQRIGKAAAEFLDWEFEHGGGLAATVCAALREIREIANDAVGENPFATAVSQVREMAKQAREQHERMKKLEKAIMTISQYMVEHFDWDGEVPLHVAVCRMFGDLLTESEALRAELDEIVGIVGIRDGEGYADAVERLYRQNESLRAELYDIGELVEAREGEWYADAVGRYVACSEANSRALDAINSNIDKAAMVRGATVVEKAHNLAMQNKALREELQRRATLKDSDHEQKAQDVLARTLERAGIPRGQREVPATTGDRKTISEIADDPYLSSCCGQRVVEAWEAVDYGWRLVPVCSDCGWPIRG